MLAQASSRWPRGLPRQVGQTPAAAAIVWPRTVSTLDAAWQAFRAGLVRPFLVGDARQIAAGAAELGWKLDAANMMHAASEAEAASVAVHLAKSGDARLLIKGDVHTDVLMRAVVDRKVGIRTARRMSHVFHMTTHSSDRPLIITDAALNVAPSIEMRLDILRNAVDVFRALHRGPPRVAVLSATESVTPSIPSSLDAAEIVRRVVAGAVSDVLIHGPLALDLAVSPQAAKQKGVDGPVAGHADIILIPNIETGNALYKALVHFGGATAAGIVIGAKVPIALTSRADSLDARLTSIALAVATASAFAGDAQGA